MTGTPLRGRRRRGEDGGECKEEGGGREAGEEGGRQAGRGGTKESGLQGGTSLCCLLPLPQQ